MKQVNVYDFDHTIYDGDASFDFIIFCIRHYPKTWPFLLIHVFAVLRFIIFRDRRQFKQAVFSFLRAVPPTSVGRFWESHEHKIKAWYLDVSRSDDIIISASPDFLLKPVAMQLGVALLATRMNSKTGKIIGYNCRGKEKLSRLKEYDESIKINNFYTDHISDIPLARVARHAYIVKGDVITAFELPQ